MACVSVSCSQGKRMGAVENLCCAGGAAAFCPSPSLARRAPHAYLIQTLRSGQHKSHGRGCIPQACHWPGAHAQAGFSLFELPADHAREGNAKREELLCSFHFKSFPPKSYLLWECSNSQPIQVIVLQECQQALCLCPSSGHHKPEVLRWGF